MWFKMHFTQLSAVGFREVFALLSPRDLCNLKIAMQQTMKERPLIERELRNEIVRKVRMFGFAKTGLPADLVHTYHSTVWSRNHTTERFVLPLLDGNSPSGISCFGECKEKSLVAFRETENLTERCLLEPVLFRFQHVTHLDLFGDLSGLAEGVGVRLFEATTRSPKPLVVLPSLSHLHCTGGFTGH